MDELPYALSEEDFVRMSNAVRRVEGLPPRRDSQAFNRAAVEENPHVWIKVTSATGSTVTLGGGTVTGYAAVWGYFDASGTGFVWTTNTAWFVPSPGSVAPAANQTFECRLLGVDTSGVPIWGAANTLSGTLMQFVGGSTFTLSTISLTSGSIQGYDAHILVWNSLTGVFSTGTNVWLWLQNGSRLQSGTNYLCEQLGVDTGGKQIWAPQDSTVHTVTQSAFSDFTPSTTFGNVTGFAITLPNAGKWSISGQISSQLSTDSSQNNTLQAKLTYSPAGSGGLSPLVLANGTLITTTSSVQYMTVPIFDVITVNASTTVQVQAQSVVASSAVLFGSGNTTHGNSFLIAQKIG